MTDNIDKLIEEIEDTKPNTCRWFHKWSVWSKPYEHKTIVGDTLCNWELLQKRMCLKCRAVEIIQIKRYV